MRLNIGPLTIELSGVTEQEIPVNSRLFLDRKPADKRADRHYTFHFVGRLPLPSNDWQAIFRRNDIVIFRKEEREFFMHKQFVRHPGVVHTETRVSAYMRPGCWYA